MRKILLATVFLLSAGYMMAQGNKTLKIKKIKSEDVPMTVIESIKKDFPDKTVSEWELIPMDVYEDDWKVIYTNTMPDGESPDTYTATIKGAKFRGTAVYNRDGRLLHSTEIMKDIPLPRVVSQAIGTQFPGWAFTSDKEIIRRDANTITHYKVDIKKGKAGKTLFVDPSGTIFREKEHLHI